MQMTNEAVSQRLALVSQPRWNKDLFIEWYGVDIWKDSPLKLQFQLWADRFKKGKTVVGTDDVDRCMFELFCQTREWVPIAAAASRLATSKEDFTKFLNAMHADKIISKTQILGDEPGVFSESFLRSLPRLLPSFPITTFSSQSSYTCKFHETIGRDLPGLNIALLNCAASVWFGEDPVEAASERDIITSEPIGLGHQIWLEFNKPLSLRPDACSSLTLVKHEALLSPYSMGGPGASELPEVQRKLHEARK